MNGRLDAGFRSSVAVQTEIPLIGQVEFDALLWGGCALEVVAGALILF